MKTGFGIGLENETREEFGNMNLTSTTDKILHRIALNIAALVDVYADNHGYTITYNDKKED